MTVLRGIYIIAYDGFEILDLAGPASVFSMANTVTDSELYAVHVLSLGGGPVKSKSGLTVDSLTLESIVPCSSDTLLVVGAETEELSSALKHTPLLDWLAEHSGAAERFGSICTGAFVLAKARLLDGHKATTHWAAQRALERRYDQVCVEPEALHVRSGNAWTSAGVSTGIDMALAMIETDHGRTLMNEIAKHLVVYACRPGHQSQFSNLLTAQTLGDGQFSDLLAWIDANLDQQIHVSKLAEQAGMSERSFYRRFARIVGETPSRYVEKARLQRAKTLIEDGARIKQVSAAVGYRSEQSFRAAFVKLFGVTPAMHRRMTR